MTNYTVKNIKGTSDNKAPEGYSSWLDYWDRNNGNIDVSFFCQAVGCSEFAINGAHVQLLGENNQWYIVPLCAKHNNHNNTSTMQVFGPLVPVNSSNPILK